jgi:hypothetical protein
MTAWLFENPIPLAVGLVAIACFFAWRGRSSGSGRELLIAGIAALLGISALAVGRAVVTAGEEASAVVEELVMLAEEAETLRAAELFTPSAVLNYGRRENSGVAIEAIRSALASLAAKNRIDSNRITRLVFRTIDDKTGEVELSCSTSTARSIGAVPTSWIIRVRNTADGWKIDRLTFESAYGKPPMPTIW